MGILKPTANNQQPTTRSESAPAERKRIKIAYIGGGSHMWAPGIIRDISLKKGLGRIGIDFHLLDIDEGRLNDIQTLFNCKLQEWGIGDRISVTSTTDAAAAIAGADFVLITISTGWLKAMRHDIAVPEKYGIYHTVGDTAGPGGWARSLRNIPVFQAYAKMIRELAPNAFVLNYTNPMGTLTKVLSDELGNNRVVGLCHGLFENYQVLQTVFGVEEKDIRVRFGGLNHFFFILDFKVKGQDGYALLREKLQGDNFGALIENIHKDAIGFHSEKWLTGELLEHYGYLPYVGDRHTCEFFNCYMTDKETMARLKLVRTSIEDREKMYVKGAVRIDKWLGRGRKKVSFSRKTSRETAADIIKAVVFDEGFTDVVNMVNTGQISNLPQGAVVETMGCVDAGGFSSLTVGPLPEAIKALMMPHAEVQLRTVRAGLSGDLNEALLALAADPVCAHLPVSDIRRMGLEMLEANRQYLPQFFH